MTGHHRLEAHEHGLILERGEIFGIGYWNSWIDCQRHITWLGGVPCTRPLGLIAGFVFCQLVFGPWMVVPSVANTSG